MRIVVDGMEGGKKVRYTYNMLDYYHPDTETSSMARTTGYTCAGMVRLVARDLWREPGVAAPEMVGRNEACVAAMIKHLEDRDVHVFRSVEEL